jgi:hypothetical protein
VLISDKVNIWREIVADDAGLVETDTEAGAIRLLERWMSTTPAERQRHGERALSCFERHFQVEEVARHLVGSLSVLIN